MPFAKRNIPRLIVGVLLAAALAVPASGQAPTAIATYQSQNFRVHSDMPPKDAEALLEQLETMLRIVSSYWGATNRRTIECNVIHNVANWTGRGLDENALKHTINGGGITIPKTIRTGGRLQIQSTVWASAKRNTTLHEAVHAYCHMNFGTAGPTWYSEGMAEMGHFWDEDDPTVTAPTYIINFLRSSKPPSFPELTGLIQRTGDSWENYAWRWALCHMLANNPNYAERFRVLGQGLLTKQRNASFNRMFSTVLDELEFEYHFFLKHLGRGFDAKICAWNWKARYKTLKGDATVSAKINAKGGWQPSLLRVKQGQTYAYAAEGQWCTNADQNWLTADGTQKKSGRLTGIIYQDGELQAPINLGAAGAFTAQHNGELYLRCRDTWTSLSDNEGSLTVTLSNSPKS